MSYVPAICNILLLGCLLGINHLYLHFLSLQLFLENLDFTSRTNLKMLKTRTSLVSILFYLVMPWTSNRLSFISLSRGCSLRIPIFFFLFWIMDEVSRINRFPDFFVTFRILSHTVGVFMLRYFSHFLSLWNNNRLRVRN